MPDTRWVLVAEDDDNDYGLILRSFLKLKLDAELQRATNGLEATEMLKEAKSPPFLVILDVKMPKVSGLEALETIRKDPAHKYLPAVILTSSDEASDLLEAHELGCNAYVRKPILYTEFVQTIGATIMFWASARIPEYQAHENHDIEPHSARLL